MGDKTSGGFSNWLAQNFNMDVKDFAQIGNQLLINKTLKPEGGKPVKITQPTLFQVSVSHDGKIYKLKDLGYSDPQDPRKADFPHAAGHSADAGNEYTLTADEYQKLVQPVAVPQQPMGGGMPGGMGGI